MNNMCQECGCQDHNQKIDNEPNKSIPVNISVTHVNDAIASQINDFLTEKKILCINLMGSPGSGKTTVIEGISKHITNSEIAVIQGDLESDVDKKRLEEKNIEAYQINTHSGCHLNSSMINKVLLDANLNKKKFLIIENVGNLVCPAGVNIGQHINIVVSSTTEGSDKPKKYPLVFMDADAIIISKFDLAKIVEFKKDKYVHDIKNINNASKIFESSSKEKDSYKEIAEFINHEYHHLTGMDHEH